jgi:GxxExxY protein
MELNTITEKIIGCAIEVDKVLGPGLLESAYVACLTYELTKAGLKAERRLKRNHSNRLKPKRRTDTISFSTM